MNILLIDCNIFSFTNHNIQNFIPPKAGLISLRGFLEELSSRGVNFVPDIIIQKENIGKRVFLADLETFNCLKVFWAIDVHLNMFWQRLYCKLFDLILTPHYKIFNSLPDLWKLPKVISFSVPGINITWNDHDNRKKLASFVGVIDKNRIKRQFFIDFLSVYHKIISTQCSYSDMLNLYVNTKILPNESICREFNFRIMEGASCGCCILTEDIGEDLYVNFEPNKEVFVYNHVLELNELLKFLSNHLSLAEKVGKAAWIRVQNEHLPEFRSQKLLEKIENTSILNKTNKTHYLILACISWSRSNIEFAEQLKQFIPLLEEYTDNIEVDTMHLRILLEHKNFNSAKSLLDKLVTILKNKIITETSPYFDVWIVCSVAALRLNLDSILLELFSLIKCSIIDKNYNSQFEACIFLAEILYLSGRICQPGFHFNKLIHCPETAIEMLETASLWAQSENDVKLWTEKMAKYSENSPFNELSLKYRAQHCINNPDDWLSSFKYAIDYLLIYKYEDGIKELEYSYNLACKIHEEKSFLEKAKKMMIKFEHIIN